MSDAAGYTVDPGALTALSANLHHVADEFQAVSSAAGAVEISAEQAFSAQVAELTTKLSGTVRTGLHSVSAEMEGLAQKAGVVRTGVVGADADVAKSYSGVDRRRPGVPEPQAQ